MREAVDRLEDVVNDVKEVWVMLIELGDTQSAARLMEIRDDIDGILIDLEDEL